MERTIRDSSFLRVRIDVSSGQACVRTVACEDLDDLLGGIARSFKLLESCAVEDAYDPAANLVLNLGVLSGTDYMTGLRTFFSGYSPLKSSRAGAPGPMWSAGSGKFATKLRHLGIDEVILTGAAAEPSLLHITPGPRFEIVPAPELVGLHVNPKIQALHERFPDAHFAVIGPAGENFRNVRYAAIALSTENQLKSGDPKPRFCGRGGFGGVMGSKNLLAIVADVPDPKRPPQLDEIKEINKEVARGEGSRRFREGGTWANYEPLNAVHALPEHNFRPTGGDQSRQLERAVVEEGPYEVKDESCYRCGIRCHKNVYDAGDGRFRAKLDYEPLNLLSSNLGIFDVDRACDLVVLVDELGMDSISCGVTLAFAMEYNRRHPDAPIADGLAYGDDRAVEAILNRIGHGELELLGQGCKRLGEQLGEIGYAMHCKGLEFPAYLPQTNPGYPWALAGGHMSMQTYLLLLFERETSLDYWVEAITQRGPGIMRDDLLGGCKFAGMRNEAMAAAVSAITGIEVTDVDLRDAVRRAYLRGFRMERAQGFTDDDYAMPAEVHDECAAIDLPHFNTRQFFAELQRRVLAAFDGGDELD
jgi:aldehyde:ferredoxin oxidoreductase